MGNIEDVEQLMHGPTIHHSLKQEIDLVLRVGGDRTRELLHFLVSTASQLSIPEQQRLLAVGLSDPAQCQVYMTEY